MSNIKSNIEELRKIIKEENFNQEEALEFLEAIENGSDKLEQDLDEANDELKKAEENVEELETEVESLENGENMEEIDCGIGVINYEEPDNILLQELLTNLEGAIKKQTPLAVSNILAALV
jgi:septal ring factor EnvC (AmiA/AmiB activator)